MYTLYTYDTYVHSYVSRYVHHTLHIEYTLLYEKSFKEKYRYTIE